jgi:hypothetical protein
MRHFLFEDKEYQYKAYFKRNKEIQGPASLLGKLLRRKGSFSGGRGHGHVRRVDLRQKCVAKMQYSNSIEAHRVQLEKYLIQEGKGLDGKAPELFGTDMEEYLENMTGKNFRIFLSPQSDKVHLKVFAEKFIEKLEKQTGYKLYWQEACHYDTAHPHAHLLINGVDKTGREIEFPPDVVKTFMRETARDLCTLQLGSRTQKDIDRDNEQELHAPRFTRLDARILELSGDRQKIKPSLFGHDKDRIAVRLETLRKLKLCAYENGGYTMDKNWEEDLKANGRYNAFLKAREELQYTDPSLMKIYSGKEGLITGKVTKVYRTDGDASDNHAVVIESLDGKSAWFVPLFKAPEMLTGNMTTKKSEDGEMITVKEKARLKEGELVSIKTYESQKGRLTPVIFKQKTVGSGMNKKHGTDFSKDYVAEMKSIYKKTTK